MGRIADNFVFRGNWNENFEPYQGPWQTWARDIDPSCLLQKKPIGSTANKSWWVTATYKNWRPSLGHTQWTRIKTDLPDQKKLLEVKAKGGWVILDGYYRWEQPPHPGEERFDKIRRDVWYILRIYIINKKDSATVFDWAKKQDFMGRWMPDPLEIRHVFLKEYPSLNSYKPEYNPTNRKRWVRLEDKKHKKTEFKIMQTTEEYLWEGGGRDCSIDEGININVPSRELIRGMGITHSQDVSKFINKNGELVAMDPSVEEQGPSVLLVNKKPLLEFLKKMTTK